MSQNKISWRSSLTEVLLIFLGITLAIGLENLNNFRIKLNQEKDIYETLISDIRSDQNEIELTINYLLLGINKTPKIIRYLYSNKGILEIQAIDSVFDNFFSINDFAPRTTTYDELKSTGAIFDLEDKKMKELISSFYLKINSLTRNIIEENKELERDDAIVRNVLLLRLKYGGLADSSVFKKNYLLESDWQWLNEPNNAKFKELEKIIMSFYAVKKWELNQLEAIRQDYLELLEILETKN